MSNGGTIPSNGRELIRNLQKRLSMVERGMSTKANAEKVEVLDKYVDQGLANFEAINTDIASIQATLNAATPLPTSSTLMLRDGAGRAQVADPSVDADIATKGYTDGAVDAIVRIPTGGSPLASTPPGDYADGFTLDSTGTGTTDGWPNTYGTIVTQRIAGHRIAQTFYVNGGGSDGQEFHVRTGVDDATWGAWQAFGGDTGWLDINWDSGYEQFSTSFKTQARLKGGIVYMRGIVRPSSGTFAADARLTIGQLPAAIPPPSQTGWQAGMVTNGDGGASPVISTTGSIAVRIGTTATPYVGLGSVVYPIG